MNISVDDLTNWQPTSEILTSDGYWTTPCNYVYDRYHHTVHRMIDEYR